jgi:N-acetylneuraminate synthase
MNPPLKINGRNIGYGYPAYIVAELSANHHQDFAEALQLVRLAKEAGADAIKLQTYTPDTLTIKSNKEFFCIGEGTVWKGKTLYELYSEAYMPWDWHLKLKEVAQELSIDFFSTPFDNTAVDFLLELGVPAFKVASFEIVDLPLLKKIARTQKPIIISTGMANLSEIGEAVSIIRKEGNSQIMLLKCTSAYPAPIEEMNLHTIPNMAETFSLPVGLSDHTLGLVTPITAVALGACLIEKHITTSRSIPGPDSTFSLEPMEFKAMVEALRNTEKALGRVQYGPGKREIASLAFRRSLFVIKDIKAGEVFTSGNVRSIRPGQGLAPKYLDEILGRLSITDVERGTPLTWDIVLGDRK